MTGLCATSETHRRIADQEIVLASGATAYFGVGGFLFIRLTCLSCLLEHLDDRQFTCLLDALVMRFITVSTKFSYRSRATSHPEAIMLDTALPQEAN